VTDVAACGENGAYLLLEKLSAGCVRSGA